MDNNNIVPLLHFNFCLNDDQFVIAHGVPKLRSDKLRKRTHNKENTQHTQVFVFFLWPNINDFYDFFGLSGMKESANRVKLKICVKMFQTNINIHGLKHFTMAYSKWLYQQSSE